MESKCMGEGRISQAHLTGVCAILLILKAIGSNPAQMLSRLEPSTSKSVNCMYVIAKRHGAIQIQ